MDLKSTFCRAFDTFEIVGVHDGVPVIYSRPFKLCAHTYPETGIVEKKLRAIRTRRKVLENLERDRDALLESYASMTPPRWTP